MPSKLPLETTKFVLDRKTTCSRAAVPTNIPNLASGSLTDNAMVPTRLADSTCQTQIVLAQINGKASIKLNASFIRTSISL